MSDSKKELLTILRLDDVDFKKGLSSNQKQVLGYAAAIGALGVGMAAMAKETADFEVETLRASRAAGQSVETFSAMRHVAEASGVSMEDLAKSTRKLIAPTDDMKTKMSAFGISFQDATGHMKSQSSLLEEISAKYKQLPSSADRAAIAMTAFGEDGTKMTSVLAENIGELTKEAEKMGLIVTGKAAEAAQKFNRETEILTGSIEGLRNSVGDSIIEFLNQGEIVGKLSEAIQSVTGWWKELDDSTKNNIISFALVAAGIGIIVVSLLGIIAVAPAVTASVTAMTGGLVVAFAAVAVSIAYVSTHLDRFSKFFEPVIGRFESLKETVMPAVNALKGFGEALAGLKIFEDLGKSAKDIDIFATVLKVAFLQPTIAVMIFVAAIETLINFWKTAFVVGKDFLKILSAIATSPFHPEESWNAIKDASVHGVETLGKAAMSQIQLIRKTADGIGRTFGDVITQQTDEAQKKVESIKPPDLGAAINTAKIDPFAGITNSLYDMAKAAMLVIDRTKNFAQNLEGMKGLFSGITSAATEFYNELAKLEEIRLKNLIQKQDFEFGAFKALQAMELAELTGRIDAELAEIEKQKKDIEDTEKKHQQRLKEIRDQFAADRKIQLDAELEAEFERMQKLFEAQVAQIQATNQTQVAKEAEKTQALNDLEDKKNQLILESQERLKNDIDAQKTAEQIAEEQRAAEKAKQAEDMANRQKELEDQKAKAAEDAAQREKEAEKLKALYQWQAGKAAFEIGKHAQMMAAVSAIAMTALMAVQAGTMIAMASAYLGPAAIGVGIAAMSLFTGLGIAAGATALTVAGAAQYPPPPLFAKGGIATGPSIFGESGKMGQIGKFRGAELAIPANQPGGDFKSLQGEVASALVSDVRGGGTTIQNLNIYNTFEPRDDAENVAETINETMRDKIRSAVPV